MLVSVVLTIVCHVCFVVCLFLTDCCCHCCLFQLRFARRQFEVQPVRDVLPPFLSLIVCDLISDGGAYLQFAGRCRPTSSGASLHLLKCLLVLVPPSLHLIKCLLVLVPPSLLLANCLLALVVGSLPSLHLLKCLPEAPADAMPLHRYIHSNAYLWYNRMSAHILYYVYLEHIHFAGFPIQLKQFWSGFWWRKS